MSNSVIQPMAYMHVGIKTKHLLHFLKTYPDRTKVIIDGDGWPVFGEPIGENGNDETTIHVIIAIYDFDLDNNRFVYLQVDPEICAKDNENAYAFITDSADWTKCFDVLFAQS